MTYLSGSLQGIGLVALVRFLTSVAHAGRLVVAEGDLRGALDLEDGVLVGAAFEQERGLPALEAIALALGNGQFEFSDAPAVAERNVRLAPEEVDQRLEQLAREQVVLAQAIPSLQGVPQVNLDDAANDSQVSLDRDTLRLLIRLDGRRTVAELARERGLLRTLRQLTQLSQLGLTRVEVPNSASQAVAEPPQPVAPAPPPEPRPDGAAEGPRPRQPGASPAPAAEPLRNRQVGSEPAWSRWRRPTNPS